jgi:NAD(P)-dependent dehydrogenase (short-subunit alcohol dehydrogenase family)
MRQEKIALITGVSRETGLGLETARQLQKLGYTVIVTARDLKKVVELAGDSPLLPMNLDISCDDGIAITASTVKKVYGKLDVLINNAAGYFDQYGTLLSTEMRYVQEAFNTNVLGALRTTKAFLPLLMKSPQGRIVNVSSSAGTFTDPVFGMLHHPANVPVYSITKLALNGLTVKLARELKETNIKVNAVCPGFVATWAGTAELGARPVSEGAKGIVWAATLGPDGPSGGFFRDGQPVPW